MERCREGEPEEEEVFMSENAPPPCAPSIPSSAFRQHRKHMPRRTTVTNKAQRRVREINTSMAKSSLPYVHEIWRVLESHRATVLPFLQCPISREPIDEHNGVLCSDGYLYDIDSLRHWFSDCVAAGRALTSPVTREVVRSVVHPAASIPSVRRALLMPAKGEDGDGDGDYGPPACIRIVAEEYGRGGLVMGAIRHRFRAHSMIGGTIPAERLSRSSLGVALQMTLGWESDFDDGGDGGNTGTIIWTAPVAASEALQSELLLPPPIADLLPLAMPILAALGISPKRFHNPERILTAYFTYSLDDAPRRGRGSGQAGARAGGEGAAGARAAGGEGAGREQAAGGEGAGVMRPLEEWLLRKGDPLS